MEPVPFTCRRCGTDLIEVEVLTGPLPGTMKTLRLNAVPSPMGLVIRREDGVWRTLRKKGRAIVPAFQIHNRAACARACAARAEVDAAV